MAFVRRGHGQRAAPPPPPPPPAGLVDGHAPVRVGGNIKPPVKTRDVKPDYPPVARDAGVQGVVIIEAVDRRRPATSSRHGCCAVVPLLDQAALDAVTAVAVHADAS